MTVEKIDILVLTESHHTDDSPPRLRHSTLLCHSGIDSLRAGVAIISPASQGWSCPYKAILVPGHAVLAFLSHRRSTESLWVLGVYADMSSTAARVSFYSKLRNTLADFVSEYPLLARSNSELPTTWSGCVAAGDWNAVIHPDDRFPIKPTPLNLLKPLTEILALCRAQDCAGPPSFPRGFTWSGGNSRYKLYSRLDRIYIPMAEWSADLPVSIPTNWSDHKLVWASCVLTQPKVEIAEAAPRLPPVRVFHKCKEFWVPALALYENLVSSTVTLETWTTFKSEILKLGSSVRAKRKLNKTTDWKISLRGELVPESELHQAVQDALRPASLSDREPVPARSSRWHTALPASMIPAPYKHANLPRRATRWGRATDPNSHPWVYSVPQHASVFDTVPLPPSAPGPWVPAFVPLPAGDTADRLDRRVKAKRAATIRKYRELTDTHSSEWYKLSSNKEADERGSRASISVEGLRASPSHPASVTLKGMLPIAHSFFANLHTPEPVSAQHLLVQERILSEVSRVYGPLPSPPPVSGPFSLAEIKSLKSKMHGTAPGPDGIHNPFYKALALKVDSARESNPDLPSFWETFQHLTEDIVMHGTNRCHFKDANLSLFFKKGDPTLVANYRPISSMNTDCKMYTNLVNSRLSPWAVSKLHPDQKGFVPGRLITEHTRLASEVAHLSNRTDTDGYIVSLDQAKAYDRTDLSWLIRVLRAMGLCPELVDRISDIVYGCHTRVRINSGYSAFYSLLRGVRQGDPLSCLLYDFSIEPLGMRLRNSIRGISVLGLPPAKLLMYADDMNLFLSPTEDLDLIHSELSATSFAIGSKFNFEKTDILLVGSRAHRSITSKDPRAAPLLRCFEGAYFIPDGSPLRILGVWVGSPDLAAARWEQIYIHNNKIICQWRLIGASLRNRVLLTKALLLSRCYYLMDGNGIPNKVLGKLSRAASAFVRGRFSLTPFNMICAPLSEGGLNCPSLHQRKLAYDAKYISNLISAPLDTPWKQWARADLIQASSHRPPQQPGYHHKVDPLLQHAFTRLKDLEPRLRQAFISVRSLRYNITNVLPSLDARSSMPLLYHHAVPPKLSRAPDTLVANWNS